MHVWIFVQFVWKRIQTDERRRHPFDSQVGGQPLDTQTFLRKCVQVEKWKKQTFVLVSQRTSSCCIRKESAPATRLPKYHGTQWQPGSRTSSYFPNTSLMTTLDCSTCTKPHILNICPILITKPTTENSYTNTLT